MAYKLASWSQESVNTGQSIIALFKGYSRFVDYMKKLSKVKKGGGKGKKDKDKDKDKDGNDTTTKKANRQPAVNTKLPNTVLDFDIISKSIVLLYKYVFQIR